MAWTTPIDWLAKAVGYPPSRADMQTISDDLNMLGSAIPGWIDSPNPWVYESTTSFKVVGADVTNLYPVGAKLSYTDVTEKFSYAGTATYAGGDTTVPIIAGTGDSLTGGAITNPRYSYMATPQGFSHWFPWAPIFSNMTLGSGTVDARFAIVGRELSMKAKITLAADSSVGGTVCGFYPPVASGDLTFAHVGTFMASGVNAYMGLTLVHPDGYLYFQAAGAGTALVTADTTHPFTWANGDRFDVRAQLQI